MTRTIAAALAAFGFLALQIGLSPAPASAGTTQTPIRINAGGAAGTYEGQSYVADTYARGGWNSWSDRKSVV